MISIKLNMILPMVLLKPNYLSQRPTLLKLRRSRKEGCYDNRHYIKGRYTYLCTYTGRHVTYTYLLTSNAFI